jgi:hypothetical protein
LSVDSPAAREYAPAAGLEAIDMMTEGTVSQVQRTQISGFRRARHLRTDADEAVSYDDLVGRTDDIAEELVARLVAMFRGAPRL